MRFLHDDDSDDPILSVVNLIDVFLVIVALLMIIVAQSQRSMSDTQADGVAQAAGANDRHPVMKPGEELTRYSTRGEISEGQGVRAGTAYRLPDGRLIYVPDRNAPGRDRPSAWPR
jgi:hypothetical protein